MVTYFFRFTYVSPASKKKIDYLSSKGVKILKSGADIPRPLKIMEGNSSVVHTHRIINGRNVFFIANVTADDILIRYSLYDSRMVHRLRLRQGESKFIVKRNHSPHSYL